MKRLLTTLLLFLFVGASGAMAQGSLTEDENGNVAQVHEQQKNDQKPWQIEAQIGTGLEYNYTKDEFYYHPEGVVYAKGNAHIIGLGAQFQNREEDFADVNRYYLDWWWANCIEGTYLHVQPGIRTYNGSHSIVGLDNNNEIEYGPYDDDFDVATEYYGWAELYVPVRKNFELSALYKIRYTDFSDETLALLATEDVLLNRPVRDVDNAFSHEVGASAGAFIDADWYLHAQLSVIFSEDALSGDWDTDWKPQLTARRYLSEDASNWFQVRAGMSDYDVGPAGGVLAGAGEAESNSLTNNYFLLGTLRNVHSDHIGTQVTGGYIKDQDYGHRAYANVALLFFF